VSQNNNNLHIMFKK